ncbi:MAG TPA: MaoC family dehydratase [Dehalococcoidia bacterium]|nr:MaoC family dehydratase [Dehalococcoidia bacterium]
MSNEVQPVTRTLTQQRIAAYARASGDYNPIHIDEAYARTTPFGGTIAHGMLVLALVGEMMHRAFGEAWCARGTLKVRFKAPTRAGDTVTASATALAAPSESAASYSVRCENQRGDVLVEGRASMAAPA